MNYEKFRTKYRNILVTGGAGFIGGALIERLLKFTTSKIYNLDYMGYASDLSRINLLRESSPRHILLKTDLSDKNSVYDAIKESSPDLILHLAAESHVDRSIDKPDNFINSNIIGTYNLLEEAKDFWRNIPDLKKQNFKFHHVSTDEVFGSLPENGKFNESTPYDPRSPYSATKATSDHLVKAWHYTYNLPIILTNCSNNYGPYQFPEKLIPLIISKLIAREPIPIYGDGNNIRDWLYVEDHVDGILLCCNEGIPGQNYCIGGYGECTNNDIVSTICDIFDQKSNIKKSSRKLISYVKDRPGHDRRYSINSNFISKQLNWHPNYSLEKGLELTVDWYLNNQEWCHKVVKRANYKGERLGTN